jgi:hypothetical protein
VSSDIKTAADIYLRNRQEAMKYKHLIEPDEENNCVVINKSLVLDIVIGDNIIILEDQYKSGYECKDCRGLGERELKKAYSTYTGHLLPFKGNNRLRIMKESEPFCRIRDIKTDNADAVPVEFIDTDDPYLPTTL